jgi:hypothetical protein
MSRDRRKSIRIESTTAAALVSVMGEPIIECVLRDISATGACISVEVPKVVPDYFFLKMEELGEQMLPRCRVRWRSGNTLGVEFFRQK